MRLWRILAVGTVSALSAITLASAQTDVLDVTWSTVDGGGGTSSDGMRYSLSGTIGQHDSGSMSGDPYALHGGFWVKFARSDVLDTMVYLPMVQR
ncbi:MAG: hypothetical protein PVJ55_09880 [Anaerolineae bacterium]|jgi:hypothetical protein